MNLKLLCVHRRLGEAWRHHVVSGVLLIILLWKVLHRLLLKVLGLLVQKLVEHVVLVLGHDVLAHLSRAPGPVVVTGGLFFLGNVLEL